MTLEIDLAGRRALVTGAGQGVGRAVALALAAAGATVTVNDVAAERAEAVVADIRSAGGEAGVALFDVTSWPAVSDGVREAGPVEILVNNAGNAGVLGWTGLAPFAETGPDDWEPFLRVNLYGVMHCTRAALPSMIGGGWGRIVTVISDAARVGESHMAAYAAAKAGAAALTRSVAREVGRHGITANCVALGTIAGPSTGGEDTDEGSEATRRLLQRYIIRRRGQPEDVAGVVAFLASPMASWVTGQTVPVNGGYSLAL